MKQELWERPICILCDMWWAWISIAVLLLIAFFSREYWLRFTGPENNPVLNATPNNPATTQFAPQNAPYSFSHPANWTVEDLGDQSLQWTLPNGITMSVHSEPVILGDTLETYAQEVVTRLPYDVISQTRTEIGGEPSIRQEVAYPGEITRVAVGYLVLHGREKYQIALAGLGGIPVSHQQEFIQEFEKVMTTFQFK